MQDLFFSAAVFKMLHAVLKIIFQFYCKTTKTIIVAFPDVDIYLGLPYHCHYWIYFDVQILWILCGQRKANRGVTICLIPEKLDLGIVNVLPIVPVFTV